MVAMTSTLRDGEIAYIQGSARKPYTLKNIGGVFSCSCPAWRNQSRPIEQRTCKHLKKLLGEEVELDRVGEDSGPKAKAGASRANKDTPAILLAQSWEEDVDPTGWWLSEKLDGVRAYWNGKVFLSRAGNTYHAPDWFVDGLGSDPLDGELWLGRGMFQRTVSVVRRQDQSEHWRDVRYLIFDCPSHSGAFEARLAELERRFSEGAHSFAQIVAHELCDGVDHMRRRLAETEEAGGEGLMLRQPESEYVAGRSTTLLKVKTFLDADARVLGHAAGKGRHKGRMGALEVELQDGTKFSIGTGFSDAQREAPPQVGAFVAFRYQELTDGGVPRFPSFVGQRDDVAWVGHDASAGGSEPCVVDGETIRLVFQDAKSDKFWEASLDGASLTVCYGKAGTDGRKQVKEMADAAAAVKERDRLVRQKKAKGYTLS